MFGRNDKVAKIDVTITENMVWLCDKTDSKRKPGQWMRDEWHKNWLQSMNNGFRLLGMVMRIDLSHLDPFPRI